MFVNLMTILNETYFNFRIKEVLIGLFLCNFNFKLFIMEQNTFVSGNFPNFIRFLKR